MKISALTLQVAIQTLMDSLHIADNGRVFSVREHARKEAAEILLNIMNNVAIDIHVEKESK